MFWAKTRPVPDASTDFGEMFPPIVSTSVSRRRSEGLPGGTRCNGEVVVVTELAAEAAWLDGASRTSGTAAARSAVAMDRAT
jgi:hypothetical protein